MYVLVNGLTQYLEVWQPYWDALVAKGFRVAVFDLLGQGVSDKPSLSIDQDEQVAVVQDLIAELGHGPIFLAGVSFGGVIALRYAIAHGDSLAGLVPISAFAELSPQLLLLGKAMRTTLIQSGTSSLMDLLFPMNLSDAWLRPHLDTLEAAKRRGWLLSDAFALQNLMESFYNLEPLTPQLSSNSYPDNDLERRVRLPHSPNAARNAARAYLGQRAGHHSTCVSCFHVGEARVDCRPFGAFRTRRAGGPMAR